jgi:hypothetical protein
MTETNRNPKNKTFFLIWCWISWTKFSPEICLCKYQEVQMTQYLDIEISQSSDTTGYAVKWDMTGED